MKLHLLLDLPDVPVAYAFASHFEAALLQRVVGYHKDDAALSIVYKEPPVPGSKTVFRFTLELLAEDVLVVYHPWNSDRLTLPRGNERAYVLALIDQMLTEANVEERYLTKPEGGP